MPDKSEALLEKKVSFRATSALWRRIERLAAADQRKAGDWIRLALEEVADERELTARMVEGMPPRRAKG